MLIRLFRRLLQPDGSAARKEALRPSPRTGSGRERAQEALRQAMALLQAGQLEGAEKLLGEALDRAHDLAEAHFQMGELHGRRGEVEDAADCYELAVHFDPGHIAAHYALAGLHKSQGRHAQAAGHYQTIVEINPQDAAAHTNLCFALHEMAAYDEARGHGERAIAINPRLPEAHHNLGLVLREIGEPEQAAQHFRKALELAPRAEIAAGLAHAYRDLGRLNEAIASYDRALRLQPDLGDAAVNRAYAYLLKGDFAEGWAQYECRFGATGTTVRDFGLPRWQGEALEGKTILVHAEQGVGDEIMFASCLPDLAARAHRVILECSERLQPLFRRSFPQMIVHGGRKEDPAGWLERHLPVHYQVPIGSLPLWLRCDRSAFDRTGAYLHADREASNEFRARLGAGHRPAVGLSWRGGAPKTRGHLRSLPLELLSPLLLHDAVFVSLQHGIGGSELSGPAAALRTFEGATDDLDRLAALISALDLVVSVDNTNVHLAGALGQPVWALLAASPEWRYGLRGDTMPWYTSAKLFRQGSNRRWEPVMAQVVAAFSEWMERARARGR